MLRSPTPTTALRPCREHRVERIDCCGYPTRAHHGEIPRSAAPPPFGARPYGSNLHPTGISCIPATFYLEAEACPPMPSWHPEAAEEASYEFRRESRCLETR